MDAPNIDEMPSKKMLRDQYSITQNAKQKDA